MRRRVHGGHAAHADQDIETPLFAQHAPDASPGPHHQGIVDPGGGFGVDPESPPRAARPIPPSQGACVDAAYSVPVVSTGVVVPLSTALSRADMDIDLARRIGSQARIARTRTWPEPGRRRRTRRHLGRVLRAHRTWRHSAKRADACGLGKRSGGPDGRAGRSNGRARILRPEGPARGRPLRIRPRFVACCGAPATRHQGPCAYYELACRRADRQARLLIASPLTTHPQRGASGRPASSVIGARTGTAPPPIRSDHPRRLVQFVAVPDDHREEVPRMEVRFEHRG